MIWTILFFVFLSQCGGIVKLIIDTDMVESFQRINSLMTICPRTLMLMMLEPCAPPMASSSSERLRFYPLVKKYEEYGFLKLNIFSQFIMLAILGP